MVMQISPEKLPRYFDCNNCGGTWEVRYPDPPIPGGMSYDTPRSKRIEEIKNKYAK
jgi:hypothetical protein